MFPIRFLRFLAALAAVVGLSAAIGLAPASAQVQRGDYLLGPGDVIRIQVFQSNDLTVEARISESGVISYPLLGVVKMAGMSPQQAENLISNRLREGKFLQNPQVTLNVLQFRSQQVSVLGNVNKAGRYPLETTGMRLSEILSVAGGVTQTGSDSVILMTTRDGRPQRIEIDLVDMFTSGDLSKDVVLQAGDTVFVNRAPNYFVYGQVQRPGQYALDRGMTVSSYQVKRPGSIPVVATTAVSRRAS